MTRINDTTPHMFGASSLTSEAVSKRKTNAFNRGDPIMFVGSRPRKTVLQRQITTSYSRATAKASSRQRKVNRCESLTRDHGAATKSSKKDRALRSKYWK